MRNLLVLFLAVLMVAAVAPIASALQSETPTSEKVIKDQAEYNAYISALNMQDAAAKGAAMEAFIARYPNSVVRTDAMEQAMAAYQQAGNAPKVEALARQLLHTFPDHIRALAIVTAIDRMKATNGDKQAIQSMCTEADSGISTLPSWPKPQALSADEFALLSSQMKTIFEGAAGFCALQKKDFAAAKEHYGKSLQAIPDNLTDSYQAAVAELSMKPIDLDGFWHCARAIHIAHGQNNAAAVAGIEPYCKAMYHNFHGSDEGWTDFVRQYGAQQTAPAVISISAKPTPCDLAVQAVKENDVNQLSFGDREFILGQKGCSAEGSAAADKVWQSIVDIQKGGQALLQLPVKVIAATKESIDGAITDENQEANKPDVHIILTKPLVKPPAPGSVIAVIGVLTSYTPNPFLFTMEKGEVAK